MIAMHAVLGAVCLALCERLGLAHLQREDLGGCQDGEGGILTQSLMTCGSRLEKGKVWQKKIC